MFTWRTFIVMFLISFGVHAFDQNKFAKHLGLSVSSVGKPWTFLGTHSIYASDSLNRQMLVVNGLSGPIKSPQIIKAENFFILQVETNDGYTSMALVGISEDEVRSYFHQTSFWKTILNELNPLPRAEASDCTQGAAGTFPSIGPLAKHFGSTLGKKILDCMGPALQGVWNSTGGAVSSAVTGVGELVKDPRKFWDAKVKAMQNVKSFINNFESKMQQLATTLMALPGEVIIAIICSFSASIGTDALIAILTGGAGVVALLARIDKFIMRILKLERALALLNRLGLLANVPIEFLKGIATGKVTDKQLDDIDTFAEHDMPEIMTGAMTCAL